MENKELLEKGLAALVSRLESTEAFVVEQAPEICKQMLYKEIGGSTFDAVFNFACATALLVIAFLCCYFAYTCKPDKYGDVSGIQVVCLIVAVLAGIFSIACFHESIYYTKYAYFTKKCPKLFLLREFASLVKK
jgi:hypothetical protein